MFMKKISLLALSATAVFALTGCGMAKTIIDELQKQPDALPQTRDEARRSLANFAQQNNGYEFEYAFRYNEYEGGGYLGQKDGSYWEVIELADGAKYGYVALLLDDGSFDRYVYSMEENGFAFDKNINTTYGKQDIAEDFGGYKGEKNDSINADITSWLFFAHSQQLSKKDTGEILGRPVTNYEFTYSSIANQLGADTKFLVSVDDELCITMKVAISSSSGDSSEKVNMDMVGLKTGNDAQIPDLLEKPDNGGEQGQDE